MTLESQSDELYSFIRQHPRLTVLSGAGVSTSSGIPDYRDDDGNWKHAKPVQYADFVKDETTRKRYWARSFAGWARVNKAQPNGAHYSLAKLEEAQHVDCLVTQNVDNLHRAAGSRNIVDLHGVLDRVRCLECGVVASRDDVQRRIRKLNPEWQVQITGFAPDGDSHLRRTDFTSFQSPDCDSCSGVIKPDVVFFGETVPRDRVDRVAKSIGNSDALLVVGSSLMVWSGFQFARSVVAAGKSLAILNRGKTRADEIATLRVGGDCSAVLERVAQFL